jgi:hypothetical protein
MAIFDHIPQQFKLLTLSQHYNYSRQGVSGITVNVFMVYLSKASTKIHYSLLITRNTNTPLKLSLALQCSVEISKAKLVVLMLGIVFLSMYKACSKRRILHVPNAFKTRRLLSVYSS